jgi:Putative lumazine-binding
MLTGTDFEDVRAVVADYLDGMIYGESDKLRGAFHPKAIAAGHFDGGYEFLSPDVFVDAWKLAGTVPRGTPYVANIVSVDITGDVGMTKVTNTCFGANFTDYLLLIKDNGKWQIVSKAFYAHPGPATVAS